MFEIDTTDLQKEERNDMARMLFKCGYAIRLKKNKINGKLKYYIVCEREGHVSG